LFVWIAARLPPGVASAATFICAITIVSTTTFDIGMFGGSRLSFEQRVLTAQAAILAVSFGALTLTALFSERRLQGASLRHQEEELQEALRAGGVVAFEWNARADLVRHSRNAASILGLGTEPVRASGMLEKVHPDDRRQLVASIRGVDRDHPSYSMTFRYRRGLGDNEAWVWLQQVATAEFDADGSPSPAHFRGLMTDITQRKRFEEEISRVQKQVERANRAKSVFLAAASHDLRQPLQTLKLLHGELQEQPLDGEGREITSGIGHSIDTMSSMLSSLLDINRLESGDLRPSKSDFAVNEIFDSVAKDLLRPLQQKGLQWRVVPTDLVVRSDRRMLEEMIRNLLSNAIRYTDRGKILLGCRRAGETVRIEVWDTGIGIPGDELPHIFEEYHRDAERGGFGLGLAIVRRLAEILGHPVDVRSATGKGTGFSIEVPRGSARVGVPEPVSRAEDGADAFRGTVLIIEDETSVRAALSRMLKSLGISVIGAATVGDAIELIARQPGPDFVICDYNLPGPMNGIESIKSLRAALGREVPAIIMTGDTRSNTLLAIASFGVSVLVKPFSADELLQLINRAGHSAATSYGSECRRTHYT
jgi:PAS domain S-box-containing protein